MFESFLNSRLAIKVRELLARHSWWVIILISLFLGLLALVLSASNLYGEGSWIARYISPANFKELLKSIGIAVLSGGVFAAILKALQFSDVFKEELSLVIYNPQFLEKRTDVEQIWRDVSDIVYKRKFPAISDKIKETILSTYFPTKVNFYYDSFLHDITFEFFEAATDYMLVTEVVKFNVKPVSKTEVIKLPYTTRILKPPKDTKTSYTLLEVKINDDDKTTDLQAKVIRNITAANLEAKFWLEMNGKDEYRVYIKHQKILCPDVDNYKTLTTSKFVNDFLVDVRFPREIKMTFFAMGTPKDFKDEGSTETRIWKSYKGLIFPNQGYRIVLSRR